MTDLSDDASLPQSQAELEAEIALIEGMIKDTEATTRALMAREDPARGRFFAQEIHAMQQQKLVLQTRAELRRVRVRRILAGME